MRITLTGHLTLNYGMPSFWVIAATICKPGIFRCQMIGRFINVVLRPASPPAHKHKDVPMQRRHIPQLLLHTRWIAAAALVLLYSHAWAAAVITTKLDDPHAVYLAPGAFGSVGDGVADDSAALQAAMTRRRTTHTRASYLWLGKYRVTRTIYVWPGVRVIGYGATRPVLLLGQATRGFRMACR